MNERDLAQKIVRELNQGAARIDTQTAASLKSARDAAMAEYRTHQSVQNMMLANHGSYFSQGREWLSHHRLWLPIAVLIIGLAAIIYWQSNTQDDDLEDLDASLLASDLPVHAFVDYRLSSWLESSKQ